MGRSIMEFTTEDITVRTKDGTETIPAIPCGNGLYVHRVIDKELLRNPSPHWAVSAKCGLQIAEFFVPHVTFNEFLRTVERQLGELDWTGEAEEIAADDAHKKAAQLFVSIITPIGGIDYR